MKKRVSIWMALGGTALAFLSVSAGAKVPKRPARPARPLRVLPPWTAFSCEMNPVAPYAKGDVVALNVVAPLMVPSDAAEKQVSQGRRLTLYFGQRVKKGIIDFPYGTEKSAFKDPVCAITLGADGLKELKNGDGSLGAYSVKNTDPKGAEGCILRVDRSDPGQFTATAEGGCGGNPSRIQSLTCTGGSARMSALLLQRTLNTDAGSELVRAERGCRPNDDYGKAPPPRPKPRPVGEQGSAAAACPECEANRKQAAFFQQQQDFMQLTQDLMARYKADKNDPALAEMYRKWLKQSANTMGMADGLTDQQIVDGARSMMEAEKQMKASGGAAPFMGTSTPAMDEYSKQMTERWESIKAIPEIANLTQQIESGMASGQDAATLADLIRRQADAIQREQLRRFDAMTPDQLKSLMSGGPFVNGQIGFSMGGQSYPAADGEGHPF